MHAVSNNIGCQYTVHLSSSTCGVESPCSALVCPCSIPGVLSSGCSSGTTTSGPLLVVAKVIAVILEITAKFCPGYFQVTIKTLARKYIE